MFINRKPNPIAETLGEGYLQSSNGNILLKFCTLELLNPIPAMVYNVTKIPRTSAIQYTHFLINNVPEHSGVCLHIGNFATGKKIDTKLCILIGKSFKDIDNNNICDLINSKVMFQQLLLHTPPSFKLTILQL